METKTPYQRKLAHPDWQRKRLEILERDGFTCMNCESPEKELHVHHVYYLPNTEPQDYPDDAYITLCADCHKEEEVLLKLLSRTIITRLRRCGASGSDIESLISNIEKVNSDFEVSVIEISDQVNHFHFIHTERVKFEQENGIK